MLLTNHVVFIRTPCTRCAPFLSLSFMDGTGADVIWVAMSSKAVAIHMSMNSMMLGVDDVRGGLAVVAISRAGGHSQVWPRRGFELRRMRQIGPKAPFAKRIKFARPASAAFPLTVCGLQDGHDHHIPEHTCPYEDLL